MIRAEILHLLASMYEDYIYAEDPRDEKARRAKLVFDSECGRLYAKEPASLREQMTLEKYKAAVVIPDVLNYLDPKQRPRPKT